MLLRYCICLLLVFTSTKASAFLYPQLLPAYPSMIPLTGSTELERIRALVNVGKIQDAKAGINAYLKVPRNTSNPAAWYLKAVVYSTLAKFPDPLESNTFENRNTALAAITRLLDLDNDQALRLLVQDEFKPVYDLYLSGFRESIERFNAKRYTEALDGFRLTNTYQEYIFSHGWGLSKLDTGLVYYTAVSAMHAKKDDEAVRNFRRLADLMIANRPEMVTAYRYLAKYYYDKGDDENMARYLGIGKSLYPKDEYLPLIELDAARDKGDRSLMYRIFDQQIAADTSNYYLNFEYGNELFIDTHVPAGSRRPANYDANLRKIETLYSRACRIQPDNSDAWLALGKHYYNQALSKEGELRTQQDPKLKEVLTSEILAFADRSIPPLEKVFNMLNARRNLKPQEKLNYKSACSLLNYAYGVKNDKAKADMYRKKYEEADKTHG